MKKIGFMGVYDKTDLVIYIAKMLTSFGKKVIVVDATNIQKAKYVIPAINPTTTYVTEFEDIDIAVGFRKPELINEYLGFEIEQELPYDYMLVDSDNVETIQNFNLPKAEKKYFVTSFDLYSLKKGLEILRRNKRTNNINKNTILKRHVGGRR